MMHHASVPTSASSKHNLSVPTSEHKNSLFCILFGQRVIMKLISVLYLLGPAFQVVGFSSLRPSTHSHATSTIIMFAGGQAPQYEKSQAELREARVLGEGSVILHIDSKDKIDYQPGHVLALEIRPEGDIENDKIKKDAEEQGGWMRGPYTVSRATEDSFDILIKVVGEKSKRLASAEPGTNLQFGGKFKVPILEGISVETTDKIVLISTGVGVGPCVGAVEQALKQENYPPIELIASYRTEPEILYQQHLDKLQKEHSGRFIWKPIITSQQGRISSTTENLALITSLSSSSTHFHLIGNGQMVQEFKTGLTQGGVPDDMITMEMYFNHKAEVNSASVERIANAIETALLTTVA